MNLDERLANIEIMLAQSLGLEELDSDREEDYQRALSYMRSGDFAPIRKFLSVEGNTAYVIKKSRVAAMKSKRNWIPGQARNDKNLDSR